MMVKLAPFLATILCLWFGKFAMPVPGKVEELGALSGGGLINGCSSMLLIISAIFFIQNKEKKKEKTIKYRIKGVIFPKPKWKASCLRRSTALLVRKQIKFFFFFLVASLQSMKYQIRKYQGFYFKSSVCCGVVMIAG